MAGKGNVSLTPWRANRFFSWASWPARNASERRRAKGGWGRVPPLAAPSHPPPPPRWAPAVWPGFRDRRGERAGERAACKRRAQAGAAQRANRVETRVGARLPQPPARRRLPRSQAAGTVRAPSRACPKSGARAGSAAPALPIFLVRATFFLQKSRACHAPAARPPSPPFCAPVWRTCCEVYPRPLFGVPPRRPSTQKLTETSTTGLATL